MATTAAPRCRPPRCPASCATRAAPAWPPRAPLRPGGDGGGGRRRSGRHVSGYRLDTVRRAARPCGAAPRQAPSCSAPPPHPIRRTPQPARIPPPLTGVSCGRPAATSCSQISARLVPPINTTSVSTAASAPQSVPPAPWPVVTANAPPREVSVRGKPVTRRGVCGRGAAIARGGGGGAERGRRRAPGSGKGAAGTGAAHAVRAACCWRPGETPCAAHAPLHAPPANPPHTHTRTRPEAARWRGPAAPRTRQQRRGERGGHSRHDVYGDARGAERAQLAAGSAKYGGAAALQPHHGLTLGREARGGGAAGRGAGVCHTRSLGRGRGGLRRVRVAGATRRGGAGARTLMPLPPWPQPQQQQR